VLPGMIEAGHGSIINVSSRASLRAGPGTTAYSASKSALNAITKSIAVDYAKYGVRCNAVAPGFVVGKEKVPELNPQVQERFAKQHLTRLPTVDDVAYAAVFLGSSESGAITGALLPIDGGGSMARAAVIG
jgi:NAD(P)-dependent dehydrogenase (short-subunit alcohol dehydrogenase family)